MKTGSAELAKTTNDRTPSAPPRLADDAEGTLYSRSAAAAMIGVTPNRLHKMIVTNKITPPAHRSNRRYLWSRDEIERAKTELAHRRARSQAHTSFPAIAERLEIDEAHLRYLIQIGAVTDLRIEGGTQYFCYDEEYERARQEIDAFNRGLPKPTIAVPQRPPTRQAIKGPNRGRKKSPGAETPPRKASRLLRVGDLMRRLGVSRQYIYMLEDAGMLTVCYPGEGIREWTEWDFERSRDELEAFRKRFAIAEQIAAEFGISHTLLRVWRNSDAEIQRHIERPLLESECAELREVLQRRLADAEADLLGQLGHLQISLSTLAHALHCPLRIVREHLDNVAPSADNPAIDENAPKRVTIGAAWSVSQRLKRHFSLACVLDMPAWREIEPRIPGLSTTRRKRGRPPKFLKTT